MDHHIWSTVFLWLSIEKVNNGGVQVSIVVL